MHSIRSDLIWNRRPQAPAIRCPRARLRPGRFSRGLRRKDHGAVSSRRRSRPAVLGVSRSTSATVCAVAVCRADAMAAFQCPRCKQAACHRLRPVAIRWPGIDHDNTRESIRRTRRRFAVARIRRLSSNLSSQHRYYRRSGILLHCRKLNGSIESRGRLRRTNRWSEAQ